MEQEILLKDHVYWSFDYEYAAIEDAVKATASVVSMGGPLHHHRGSIALTEASLIIDGIDGDFTLCVPLSTISELYHGFDDVFTNTSVKNFGMFWQPLRIRFFENSRPSVIYLIIGHNGIFTHNKQWYKTLTEILS